MAEISPTSARRFGMYMRRVPAESVLDAMEPAPVSGGPRQLCSVVSKDGEPGHPFDDHVPLAPGTVVDEVRRFARWDHPVCTESSFFIVADMRVVGGSREGEIVEVVLGAGWEHEYDPRATSPTWLERCPESPTP